MNEQRQEAKPERELRRPQGTRLALRVPCRQAWPALREPTSSHCSPNKVRHPAKTTPTPQEQAFYLERALLARAGLQQRQETHPHRDQPRLHEATAPRPRTPRVHEPLVLRLQHGGSQGRRTLTSRSQVTHDFPLRRRRRLTSLSPRQDSVWETHVAHEPTKQNLRSSRPGRQTASPSISIAHQPSPVPQNRQELIQTLASVQVKNHNCQGPTPKAGL